MKLQEINKNYVSLIAILFCVLNFSILNAQTKEEKKAQREAREFAAEAQENLSDNNFAEAEANYRKAIARDPQNAKARYNLGNMYYNQEKNTEASFNHKTAATTTEEKAVRHQAFHNQGNAFMKQKQYEKAVNAYKNALRNNPTDDETRYNLALAKKMLEKEQQENDQNQDNKDQNKDNQDQQQQNQDQKEGENKDQENKKSKEGDQGDNKDNQEKQEPKENEGDQKKDQQDQQQNPKNEQRDEKKENQQPQQAKGQLSPQQIKSLLEAMENKEKEIQDKINAQKAKQGQRSNEKDW